jgi:hypothetical protein
MLKEEKATFEGMVESRDELIMEIAKETRLDHMGEDAEDEEGYENADNIGDAAAPPAAATMGIIMEEDPIDMVPEQEAHVAHEVILVDAELEMPQSCLYHMLVRDYEESPSWMMDDLDDLDDDSNECRSDLDEWFPEDGNNDRD